MKYRLNCGQVSLKTLNLTHTNLTSNEKIQITPTLILTSGFTPFRISATGFHSEYQ